MKDFLQLSNTKPNKMRQEVKLGSSQNTGKHFMFSILLPEKAKTVKAHWTDISIQTSTSLHC